MSLNKSLKYTVCILLGILLGLYLGIIVLLNIPYVQGKLSVWASKELKALLNTEVSVGKVDMGLLNRIIVQDVLLHDQHNEELLKVARLSAKFEILPLFQGKITVSSVQLFGFSAHMNRETPEAVPNFQFVLDALASKDTVKAETNLDLRINTVLIRRGRLNYDVLSEPETLEKFNINHISINGLAATLSLKTLTKDSLNATIRRFNFDEQSGFSLQRLSAKVTANNSQLDIKDFGIELTNSIIQMDSLIVRYDSLPDLYKLADNVRYDGILNASVVLKDATPFVPALSGIEKPLKLQMSFSGQGKNISFPSIELTNHQGVTLQAEASLDNWSAGMDMYIMGNLTNLYVNKEGMKYLMTSTTGKVPPILQRVNYIRVNGDVTGYLHDLMISGLLQSGVGTLRTSVMMSTDKESRATTYSGYVRSADLNVGKLLNQENKFGNADFNIDFNGFNYENQYPESYINGNISSLEYSQYQYSNIELDGVHKDGGFNGKLAMDDENGSILVNGNFNTESRIPDYNLKAVIQNFNPHNLHLTDKYEGTDFSVSLTADFTGNSIDDMNGRILVDSLLMRNPDNDNYFLDNLTVTARQVSGEKELRIQSSFMTAVVRGDYSYHTIPASVIQTVQRYIPSLLPVKDNMPEPHNNFKFDIRLENTEILSKVFLIPLELDFPVTLNGYFNDNQEKLRVEGYFPNFKYNGTRYDSGTLLCENTSDQFNCALRGGMLLKSGAMLNLSVEAKAKNDHLETTVNWGNNTNVTYGGKIDTDTRFHKTEGSHPILNADIKIKPTKVVLNDTIWNIHPSEIAVDSGRIYIHDFWFEHGDQYLKINGKLAQKETDSCLVDLKNIRLDYVMDIVQFDDVLFSGLITGKVNLKSVMKEPDMRAYLNVHDFTLNHSLMGEAAIVATWDKELEGVQLNADIKEKDIASTHVDGYVSGKLKGLDLHILANNANVGLLRPFVDGIFNEFEGRATGPVRLYGDFKHLDLEGGVLANAEAKVEVLNTYFQLRNDSILISSGSIDFKDVKIYDREGHSGVVNGYLHHNKLKNLMYHFNISGTDLLMYDTHEAGDMPFYGTVYGSGNVVLDGGNNALNVDVSVTTSANTTFTYITGVITEATSNQFITFVDKTPRRTFGELETTLYHHSNAKPNNVDEDPPMDMHINMLINALPNATMKIIMDPIAGDAITAVGSGTLRANYFNKGDFLMYGSYVIQDGIYKLSMQEIIRKDFVLQSGGTVTFSGDPYDANLNVQAVYTVNSASLNDLVEDPSRSQGTVRVNCLLNLTGNLSNPDIKFDLELPTVREEDKELVRSITSTEEQMNTQIIYLLGVGKFYTYDYANDQSSSNATSSLAFTTISGQLNNMLSQWMDNKNWNIGANLSTGEGWSDVEAEAILSGRLLNNRLIINGNFGYRENVMTNSNFVGDFEARWLLTKSGDIQLKGYNQTNDRYFTKSTLTTQGIGIIYKKDFNKWNELFRWFLRKRSSSKQKQEQNTEER